MTSASYKPYSLPDYCWFAMDYIFYVCNEEATEESKVIITAAAVEGFQTNR